MHRFEVLRAELAKQDFAERGEPADPERLFAFFEAYFSNWIEGTEFEIEEAEEILFEGRVPTQRPADAHDIQGTFEAINDPTLRAQPPTDADMLEYYLREVHRRIMRGRPETGPGDYKDTANRAGMTTSFTPSSSEGPCAKASPPTKRSPPAYPERYTRCSLSPRYTHSPMATAA